MSTEQELQHTAAAGDKDCGESGPPAGHVRALWRFPVKSMAGETVERLFMGFGGVMGDRVFAFVNTDSVSHFPWITGRDYPHIVRYKPRFLDRKATIAPAQTDKALSGPTGLLPAFPAMENFAAEVETVEGWRFDVTDTALCAHLSEKVGCRVALRQGLRSMADCRPVSIMSSRSPEEVGRELDRHLDLRRFRMNIIVDWAETDAPRRDTDLVGKTLSIGSQAKLAITDPDWRCKMIAIDPETGTLDTGILRHVAKTRDGALGIYAQILKEGIINTGDPIYFT